VDEHERNRKKGRGGCRLGAEDGRRRLLVGLEGGGGKRVKNGLAETANVLLDKKRSKKGSSRR